MKGNQAELLELSEWAFSYPGNQADSLFSHSEVRSGEVWSWEVESRTVPEGMMTSLAEVRQVIRCQRTIVDKASGEISREIDDAVTNLSAAAASAADLYRYWRGHWEIENRSHHKRDVVFGEDSCRSRKGAQVLAALRNLIIGLIHLKQGRAVKRAVRRFQAHPEQVLALLGWNAHSG